MKKLLALLMSLAMVFAMVACSSTDNGGSTNNGSTNNGGSTDNGGDTGDDTTGGAADLKLAVILKTQATDFWLKMWQGAENYANENGLQVDLYAAQSDSDYEGQLAILENCINTGDYDAIAIAPCSAVNMITGVKAANDADITIINLDEQFDAAEMESQGAVCSGYIASDNVAVGYQGAEYLCSMLSEGDQVAVIEGISGNVSSEDRANGARSAFEDNGMEIIGSQACNWDMQTAMDTAATWITQYPDLKAIYCCNDGMAMGVMQAIANAGKTGEILLCGTDGDADAVTAVAEGNMTATVAQDSASMGARAVEMLVDACLNPDNYPTSTSPEKSPVDAVLLTIDNAAEWQQQ